MRKRERQRIEKLQRTIKAEQSRYSRQSKVDRSQLAPRESSDAFRAMLATRDRIQEAQRKLAVAKLAPTRAQLRDVAKRPGRYKQPGKATKKLRNQEEAIHRQNKKAREITLSGAQGRAEKLLMDAFKRGESLNDSYKRIAKETGLSPHEVYSIGKYNGPKQLRDSFDGMDEMEDEDEDFQGEDSPDDFDDFE